MRELLRCTFTDFTNMCCKNILDGGWHGLGRGHGL
jgi:hypothetical protein